MNDKNNIKNKALKLLDGAYDLETPEDNIVYYKNFSKVYDQVFASGLEYSYPKYVADEFMQNYNNIGSICDIGCGTGLVANELKYINSNLIIDGFDISPDMIDVARHKNIYRDLYEIDLTKPIRNVPNNYSGIISAGAFTHGHLGPEIIKELLSICVDGAILTIGINAIHYKEKGFEKFFHNLEIINKIKMKKISNSSIYSNNQTADNKKNNMAIITVFEKIKS
ncbi:MAG: class I SAM-dependent methyltransferase [Alphaproteobacteria bacterium]|nr:MAG: class I SAM-dependent methyltransferase [Alphaproteobacteria bacterium]